ncbi:MAG: YkgJ family cysteine cluster protein [Thermodesulfobacteriota bacterium]
MMRLKEKTLEAIFTAFAAWQSRQELACARGCSTCCSQQVEITALEGDMIMAHVREEQGQGWLAGLLEQERETSAAPPTHNGYAQAYLAGEELADDERHTPLLLAPCPFLLAADSSCAIYPARPMACRVMGSTTRCKAEESATMTPAMIAGGGVALQIVEHLGQGEYWGNMLDVLLALGDQQENGKMAQALAEPNIMNHARARLRPALPVPGFIIADEERGEVEQLMGAIFATEVEGRKVEDILNGR